MTTDTGIRTTEVGVDGVWSQPYATVDKAIGVLEQIATGRLLGGSNAEVLSHVRSLAAAALKDLKA